MASGLKLTHSHGPLVTSTVVVQQLHGLVSTGNALDSAHYRGLEATLSVL